MWACGLNAVGMPIDLVLGRDVPALPKWAPLGSSAAALLLMLVLLAFRRRPSNRLATSIFLVNTAIILVALWFTSTAWAAAPGTWIPFQANKLGALATAMLAPDLVTGAAAIGGFVGMVLLRYMTLPAAQQHRFPVSEPWTILIYGVFALALLIYRVHRIALSRRMMRVRTESIATQRLARAFLALRDYTNTPLQTIDLATKVIRKRHPELGPILDRIDRSVDRLYRLNHTFSIYESRIVWTEDDVSPDPSRLVASDLREGTR
ncbi:MAG TPA: hypothetical protein VN903_33500 [Polyangia bacterium]|nr:hypothetical protein [Polyangia bacterium]